MKVYQRLASAFAQEGVSAVFGMTGDATMHWVEALDQQGVKIFEVRHEGTGLGMADGWARATRTPGVATATCGPGVTQLATALVTARRASSPLVAFVGEANDDENVQHLDQALFATACETGFVRVDSAQNADEAVRKAFYRAKLESRPIMLSATYRVQQAAYEDDDEPYKPSSALRSSQSAHPDPRAVEAAADIIAASRKPIIVVGQGAMWSGAGDAVIKLGTRIGALIATSLRAKGWLSTAEYHVGICGTFATRTAIQMFAQADCVIAAGATLNRYTTLEGNLYPDARIVHIDCKPHALLDGGLTTDCYIQSDARAGLQALDKLLAARSVKLTGYRTADVKSQLATHFDDRAEFPIEPGRVDPRLACLALDEIVPGHISLALSNGATGAFTHMLFNRPRTMTLPGYAFGCIGQMLPAVMGAIVATGNKPMMLVDGDASFMMHLAEFETAVRYKLPLLAVVLNDQTLGAEYHQMCALKMKADLVKIPTPDLGDVARALGGKGCLARSVEEVRAAARAWVTDPGPMIIDVRISGNVLPLPQRRILYARDE